VASIYLVTWHVALAVGKGQGFDLDEIAPGTFEPLVIIHAFAVFLTSLDREVTDFRWRPILDVSENFGVYAHTYLGILLTYTVFVLLSFLVVPGGNSQSLKLLGMGLTATFLLQTAYVAVFFLIGREKLWQSDLSWNSLFFRWIRRKSKEMRVKR